ncbi:hypothetical protein [Georgenia yuyongxinii]
MHYWRLPEFSVPVLATTDDVAGRFPWEPGYSVPRWRPPRPGPFRA